MARAQAPATRTLFIASVEPTVQAGQVAARNPVVASPARRKRTRFTGNATGISPCDVR